MLLFSFDGSLLLRFEDDTLLELLFQLPPRSPRDEPVIPPTALRLGPPRPSGAAQQAGTEWFAVGVPCMGHPTFYGCRQGSGLHAATLHIANQSAIATAEVFQTLFPQSDATVVKDCEANEVNAVIGPNEPVLVRMNLQFEAGKPLAYLAAHLAELAPRLAEQ